MAEHGHPPRQSVAGPPDLPPRLVASARTIEGGARWMREWSTVLMDRLAAWDLELDLPPGRPAWAGQCAVVVPVTRRRATGPAAAGPQDHDPARGGPSRAGRAGAVGRARRGDPARGLTP